MHTYRSRPSRSSSSARLHVLCVLGLSLPLAALAGRPLQTEDAGVLEASTCEVEGAAERLRQPGAARSSDNALQLACGVGGSSQLALAASRSDSGGPSSQGLRLGGKTELWNAGKDSAAFTLAWGLSAAKAAGVSWKKDVADVAAVYSLPAAGLNWHFNLGLERELQARSSTTVWGLAAEHPGFGAWAPMAELFGDDRGAPWWNLGLRWTLSPEKAFVDLSYGRQMASGQPQLLTAGFKFVF